MSLELRDLEAVRVQPGEVLVLRLPADATPDDIQNARDVLDESGIGKRIILIAANIEVAVVEGDPS